MRDILERLVKGEIKVDEAERLLRLNAIVEVEALAKLDVNREVRKGIPEVVLADGKAAEDVVRVVEETLRGKGASRVILSRVDNVHIDALKKHFKSRNVVEVDERARVVVVREKSFKVCKTGGKVGVLTAGTSDIPVAEEARVIAEAMGCEVTVTYDVGIAGIHRLFPPLRKMLEDGVDIIVAVAGREGAMPSVVAGLVDVPVVGVPTSVGYGFGEKGTSALMAMLQACSLGIAVVNIDGGVAAGALAALIANRVAKARGKELRSNCF